MSLVDALVPVASVLLGAAITYWLNVRTRRQNYVDDLFKNAFSAVAEAQASVHYLTDVGRPQHLSDAEYLELQKWLVTEGVKNWAQKAGAANLAVARLRPFQPAVSEKLPF